MYYEQPAPVQLKGDAMSVIEIIVTVMVLLVYAALLVLEIFTMLGSNEKLRRRWFK